MGQNYENCENFFNVFLGPKQINFIFFNYFVKFFIETLKRSGPSNICFD